MDVVVSLWAQQLVFSGVEKATRSKCYIRLTMQHLGLFTRSRGVSINQHYRKPEFTSIPLCSDMTSSHCHQSHCLDGVMAFQES